MRSGQTTANEQLALEEWAARAGHQVVAAYEDSGVSGAKGRDHRILGFDQMLKDAATRRRFDMLAAWSVDRLGRSVQDLVATLNDLRAANVDLFLAPEASTPPRRLGAPCTGC